MGAQEPRSRSETRPREHTRVALSARGFSKRFGGVEALSDVDMVIREGEIHGLLGENGSGKSTFIKILAGFHAPDGGSLKIHDRAIALPLAPGAFREYGMEFVHQDLALIDSLTAVENLRIAELTGVESRWFIAWPAQRRNAAEIFVRYGIDIRPGDRVAELRPVEKAQVAIARAVEGIRRHRVEGGILILDEPTIFLPRDEIDQLFALIKEVASSGCAVLLVSHDLDEVREITDRVTVLRDGRLVGTMNTADASEGELVRMIVGGELAKAAAPAVVKQGRSLLRGEHVSGRIVDDFSFDLHAGEVLGITGLVGSGFEELPYLLFGVDEAGKGLMSVGGEIVNLEAITPRRAMKLGMALVPADRQRDGSILTLPVAENLLLPRLRWYFRRLRLQRGTMLREAATELKKYDVRPPRPQAMFSSLSGGNQQKVVVAKWLETDPGVLLLHEPTQGVDVGARQQIFALIRRPAEEGRAVLCASSDHEQLAAVCGRVIVLGHGRQVATLVGDEISKDAIATLCYDSVKLLRVDDGSFAEIGGEADETI